MASPRCRRLLREQHFDGGFVSFAIAGAAQVADLPAILGVEERSGDRSIPAGHDGLHESVLLAFFLAVVREYGLVAGKEPAHEDQIAVLVQADADYFQALGGVLL